MRHHVFATLVLVACSVPTITERAPISGTHRAPDRIPPSSVHGGFIRDIAVTDQGDAAISVDSLGEVRLWPMLDGTREPVQLRLAAPREVAIAHAGSELVVATIDHAGNGQIVRLSRDGAIRGTKPIPGEVAVVQLAAIDGGVLALRSDQTIERYDVNGQRRGRLVGDPGERFTHLAARHNGAAVLVNVGEVVKPVVTARDVLESAPPRPTASNVRFIVIGDELAANGLVWGPRRSLPETVDAAALGLAPNHKRIAVLESNSPRMHVLDASDLHEIGTPAAVDIAVHPQIGFVDDDDVVDIDRTAWWWPEPTPREGTPDDLAAKIAMGAGVSSTGAVGDKLAISASDSQLQLREIGRTRFLGWDEDTSGTISALGDGYELTLRDGHVLGLDRELQLQYSEDFVSESYVEPVWIDAHRVLVSRRSDDDRYTVMIVDPAVSQSTFALASFEAVSAVAYLPELREVAVQSNTGVHRYTLDAQFAHPVELSTLDGTVNQVRLVDPATHDGIVAFGALMQTNQSWALMTWHDSLDVGVTSSSQPEDASHFKAFDDTGAAYMTTDDELEVVRGTEVTRLGRGRPAMFVVPSHDGQLIATLDGNELAMRDAQGHELWRRASWDTETFAFSTDQRRLAVQTTGGLLLVDAQTGERIVSACAFGFGIHDTSAHWFPRGTPTVCED